MSTQYDIWTYRVETVEPGLGADVVGYHVEALDGGIGKVDEATDEVGASSIVVDTGRGSSARRSSSRRARSTGSTRTRSAST